MAWTHMRCLVRNLDKQNIWDIRYTLRVEAVPYTYNHSLVLVSEVEIAALSHSPKCTRHHIPVRTSQPGLVHWPTLAGEEMEPNRNVEKEVVC